MSDECKTPCLMFRTKDDVLKDPLWTEVTAGADTREKDLGNIVKVWGSVPWLAGPDVTSGEIEIPGYPPFEFGTSHIYAEPESLFMYMQCVFREGSRKPIRYVSNRIILDNHAACLVRDLAFFTLLSYVAMAQVEIGTLE